MFDLRELLMSLISVLIALTVHEYCHGYAAYKLGDDTAKNLGRLTLNPLKHLDPYGTISLLLFRMGWAKPVPVNARNFKDPKKGFAITALAGPLSNLTLAFISTFLWLLVRAIAVNSTITDEFNYYLALNTLDFIAIFFSVNIGLGLFNLLPIPPFDGSRLLYAFLPPKIYFGVMKYERKIYYGVLVWLFFGSYAAEGVRMIPFVASNPVLNWLAGILSLSGMLHKVIEWVTWLMLEFWQLIPFLKI